MEACAIDIFSDGYARGALQDAANMGYFEFVNVTILNSEVEYIDIDEGARILVAGALADAVLNGTVYTGGEDFNRIVANLPGRDVLSITTFVRDALKKVIADGSALNELRGQDAMDYTDWLSNIKLMIDRLPE